MLQVEHSAILSTFIKLPIFIIEIFVLSIFECPNYTGLQAREVQDYMEEIDGERLPWIEAHGRQPPRQEYLEIRCEICYAFS